MRYLAASLWLASLFMLSGICHASNPSKHDCVLIADAAKYVGTSSCVRGTVLQVEGGSNGLTFLDFCSETKDCPFRVVVFPADSGRVGDIRRLEGRQIEIKGTIEDHNGRAEIVLRRTQQLGESAFVVVPPVPTDYDVERQGHYSAGKYSRPKAKKSHKQQGRPVSIEDPEEPQ